MIDVAIIGSGNIGTDLLVKALRSTVVRPRWMVGIDPASEGLRRARGLGLRTTAAGVDGLVAELGDVRLAFDATSAHAHARTSALLRERGVVVVDLTPAALGPYCVPPVNLREHAREPEVSMVTCGGQATIPIVAAVSRVQAVGYAEIVATVASRSVGPGTRQNIDEFTRTTAGAIERVGGARRGKAIIIINPADPPLVMRVTIHCLTDDEPRRDALEASLAAMIAEVQGYVPGYRPVSTTFDGKRVTVSLLVEGRGDTLPAYAGNLDIMTSAALRTAEMLVEARGWI